MLATVDGNPTKMTLTNDLAQNTHNCHNT